MKKEMLVSLDSIRNEFPILSRKVNNKPLVYFDNGATSQKPQMVIDSIIDAYSGYNSNIHRGVHTLSQEASAAYEEARDKVKNFINASDRTEVIFTNGTTESINLIASTFSHSFLHIGDEVLVTEMEHHSNIVPWQQVCDQHGATLKVLPMDDKGELKLEALDYLISNKTRIIAVTYVSNVLGTINDIKSIVKKAHSKNVPVLVDAAQAIPHFSVDVQDLDCDFLAFSGHKMYSATGIGILYGKKYLLEQLSPYRTGGGMIASVDFTGTTFADLPFKFEAGTPNYVGAISLGAAIDYMQKIGYDFIQNHEEELISYTLEKIDQFEGLTLYGNAENRSAVFSFNLEGIHPYDAGQLLDKLGIAVRTGMHCTEPIMKHFKIPGTIRVSYAIYNTTEEIDILFAGLKRIQEMLK